MNIEKVTFNLMLKLQMENNAEHNFLSPSRTALFVHRVSGPHTPPLLSPPHPTRQVFVMSSQIFCNMLLHGFLNVSRVNLLILDECHHTVKDSPMRQVNP